MEKARALKGSPCCKPRELVIRRLCCPGTCTYPVASRDSQAREQAAKDSLHSPSACCTDSLWTVPKALEMSVWRKRYSGLASARPAILVAKHDIPLGIPIPCCLLPRKAFASS
eukprot:3980278-Amphidinium_carterae.4